MNEERFDSVETITYGLERSIARMRVRHEDLDDWEVLTAVETLIRVVNAERAGRPPSLLPMAPRVADIFKTLHEAVEPRPEQVTADREAFLAGLRRIRRAIRAQTRQGRRRGFLASLTGE
ncbi:MAG: hypothetical protein JXB35_16940 [Anaerolineae bacterium]|nr:hypothetical protein [Anaerolineae bacterium]